MYCGGKGLEERERAGGGSVRKITTQDAFRARAQPARRRCTFKYFFCMCVLFYTHNLEARDAVLGFAQVLVKKRRRRRLPAAQKLGHVHKLKHTDKNNGVFFLKRSVHAARVERHQCKTAHQCTQPEEQEKQTRKKSKHTHKDCNRICKNKGKTKKRGTKPQEANNLPKT